MNKKVQALALTCVLWLAGGEMTAHASEEDTPLKLQLNDEIVSDESSAPFLDENGNSQVPLRFVMEKLGMKLDWAVKNGQNIAWVSNGKKGILIKTGEKTAEVNGKRVEMNAEAELVDGKMYVPLRFISESLGNIVQWDGENKIAIIATDGKYHAPAWYAPVEQQTLNVLDTAFDYIGVPYVWGGSTPKGFDCSGYVQYVFKKYGVELPRTAREMYMTVGTNVDEPQPGDLVFFKRSATEYHVGIYVGNQQFISATTSKGIIVDEINNSYWGKRYVGAKKI